MKPVILLPGTFSQEQLDGLKSENKIWRIADVYEAQLQELAEVRNPGGDPEGMRDFTGSQSHGDLAGTWVYYPWSGVLMHCVGPGELFELRTNRNQNLITKEEQAKLAQATVAVAGMSVGSGMALSCVYSGLSNSIRLADFDTLSTANLNRLREPVADTGASKVELCARHIYEANPFADIQIFDRLSEENIDEFVRGAAAVFDEVDDFKMKIRLRLAAKTAKTPVVMLTSLGDNILVDVERYDQDNNLPLFHGLLGNLPEEILNADIGEREKVKYAAQLVGIDYVPTRALSSLLEINKSLVGRPQLYSTVAIGGGLAPYLVRRLALGQPLPSARSYISLDKAFSLDAQDQGREEILAKLKEMMG